ncbi:MAG: hypothetical protein WCQ44_12035, partial [Opitutaceae bacterium]
KNPQAAAAFQKGDITLGGDEQGMAEGEMDEAVRAGTRSQNYADARIVRPKTQGERDALAHNIVTGRNDKRSLPAHPNTSGSNSGFTGSAATVNTNKPTAQRFVAKPNAGDGKGMGEGVLDTVKSAVGLGNKPPATTAEKNAAFHAANKGRNMPSSGNASVDYDRFTGRDKVTEKDVGKPNNATTGFEALVRKLTPKYGKEAATKIAGSQFQKQKMNEVEAPTIDNMTAMGANLGAGRNPNAFESKKGVNPFAKKDDKTAKKDDKAEKIGKEVTKDIEKKGAAPKKGVNPFAKKKAVKEDAKPDFPDIDDDGNTKETISKAAQDAKKDKKKVKEGMEQHLKAAWHQGRAHGLTGQSHNGKHYEDMEEANMYHRGYKHGLDECYGQPIVGLVREADPIPATVPGMADAAEPSVDEGTAFTAALARTPNGGQFNVGGKTFKDRSGYDAKLDEFAFESWDNQLNAILNEDAVSEGLSVSISKGQQNSPDSVSVTAQDGEADQLLGLLKQAGLGLFGGEAGPGDESSTMMMPSIQGSEQPEGELEVVDDHDNMLSLIRKMTGQGPAEQNGDYADEEGHSHEEGHGEEGHSHEEGEEDSCNEC